MEIRIKTEKEFFDSHVTVEIVADRDETPELTSALSPSVLGELAGQKDRIADLEAELAKALRGRTTNREWAERAETELAGASNEARQLREQTVALEAEVKRRDTEVVEPVRQRAKELEAERDRAVGEMRRRLTQVQVAIRIATATMALRKEHAAEIAVLKRELADAYDNMAAQGRSIRDDGRKLSKIRSIVDGKDIREALLYQSVPGYAQNMKDALKQIQATLHPDEETSQA